MTRWTWKELAHVNSYGVGKDQQAWRDKSYEDFLVTYGYMGILALAISRKMSPASKRSQQRPTIFDNRPLDALLGLYRRMYWRTYGKKECEP
jgi:hypothetical protein